MVICIDGVRVIIRKCHHCAVGRFVLNSSGTIIGHYQPSPVFTRGRVAYEPSDGCPGPGKRAYGTTVIRRYRSEAIMAAIRCILSLR
jgi:nucleoside-diphosphate-sugar epimerase